MKKYDLDINIPKEEGKQHSLYSKISEEGDVFAHLYLTLFLEKSGSYLFLDTYEKTRVDGGLHAVKLVKSIIKKVKQNMEELPIKKIRLHPDPYVTSVSEGQGYLLDRSALEKKYRRLGFEFLEGDACMEYHFRND